MSNYAKYMKERENYETLENDSGFLTYLIAGKECFIRDMYIEPDFRGAGESARMLNELSAISREQGCSFLSATICPSTNGATASMKFALKQGFQIKSSGVNFIVVTKEL